METVAGVLKVPCGSTTHPQLEPVVDNVKGTPLEGLALCTVRGTAAGGVPPSVYVNGNWAGEAVIVVELIGVRSTLNWALLAEGLITVTVQW